MGKADATPLPPILWFGNALVAKPVVLTVGANPSRQEYLSDTSAVALAKFDRSNGHGTLSHLERSASRFRVLAPAESLADVLSSPHMRSEILTGYNKYFVRNPYIWFGRQQEPYNVEAFLRGMGASYYDRQPQPLQALHIDLFRSPRWMILRNSNIWPKPIYSGQAGRSR